MLFTRLSRLAWWATAVLIVSLAVALSAARILLPGMAEYKAQIETAAGNLIGHPVHIDSLDAAWRGLSPVLRLKHVVIHDPQFADGVLVADEVQVGLDVARSLTQRAWFTSGIRVIGVAVGVRTDLSNWQGDAAGIGPLRWLLQQKSIVLEDVRLDWTDPGMLSQPVHLSELALQLVNDGDRHQVLLQCRLSESLGDTLVLAADLSGPVNNLNAWQGRAYAKTAGLNLAAATGWLGRMGLSTAGRADLELWAGVHDRKLDWGTGSVRIQAPALAGTAEQAPQFSADQLGGTFHWQMAKSGWQLELHDLALQRDMRDVWPASEFRLAVETGDLFRVRGTASHIVLDEVNAVLPLVPWMDADALTMVERLQPAGQLRDAEFSFSLPEGKAPRASLRARFDEMGFGNDAGLPGIQGLSGSIEGNLQSGYLRLDSAQASLVMPKLFSVPLPLSYLSGQVHWQRYANGFRIESQRLAVASGDTGAAARLQLDWPYRESSPWLDLQVALGDFPLARVGALLPDQVMSPRATAWLQQAFDAGTASNARLLLQGRLDQLPFDAGEGRLEASFDFQDAGLNYHPEWGRLDELQGSALFLGRSMRITADSARILESPVQRAVATIDDFKRPLLKIKGTVGGTLSGMLQYVASSPLGERFGALTKQVAAGGDAQLHLSLGIPLKRELGKTRVDGSVVLDGNELEPSNRELTVSKIKGKVRFTQDGVTAEQTRAVFLGQPVAVSVYQGGETARSKTIVDIKGKLNLLKIAHMYQPAMASFADGLANWHALVHIPNRRKAGDPGYEVQLQSDLVGLGINLPEPLHKEKQEARNLLVNWVSNGNAVQTVLVSYADLLDARLLPTQDFAAVQRADLRFGGGLARLPESNRIQIGGELQRLDPGQWIALFKPGSATARPAPGKARMPPVVMDLAVAELAIPGHRIQHIDVESEPQDPWLFRVQGEGASGTVRWLPAVAATAAKLQIDLEHLNLQPETDPRPEPEVARVSRPDALPDLDFNIGDLRWRGRELGRVGVRGKRVGQGMEFELLSMECRAVVFNGRGAWTQENGVQRTRFSADISAGQLDELLKLFGDNSAVQGGELKGNVTFNWPGGPAAFSLNALEGDLFIKARDGRLVRVDEGAGKLLNLISLNSLQRRLTLDFNDVIKEGFSFNEMSGHFIVMDGDAYTSDFTINGSSAIIAITGRTGLADRDYDQLVTVTPQVSSSLPIAGAIAGGPAVGAAVFLAEKLVGKEFNRMTEIQYRVTGSWEKPEYERLGRKRESDSAPAEERQ